MAHGPFNSQLPTQLSKICVRTLIIFSALYNCHLLKIKISLICPFRFVFIVFKYIHCYISLNRFFCLVLLFTKYFRYIIVFIPVWLCRLQFAIKMPYACVIPPFVITIAMRLCHFRSLIFLFKVCKTWREIFSQYWMAEEKI